MSQIWEEKMDKKKILVLHANPNKDESFTWAICKQYLKGLKDAGTPYNPIIQNFEKNIYLR